MKTTIKQRSRSAEGPPVSALQRAEQAEAKLQVAEVMLNQHASQDNAAKAKASAKAKQQDAIVKSRHRMLRVITSVVIVWHLYSYAKKQVQSNIKNGDSYNDEAYCNNPPCLHNQSSFYFENICRGYSIDVEIG
uniref:Transmembrane protein n=1 Tax=Panagrellus redivivus TaxID=6233 RepID=A0A7E4V9U7_PANRE